MNLSRKWLSEFVTVDANDKRVCRGYDPVRLQGGTDPGPGRRDLQRGGGPGAVHGAPSRLRPHVGVPDLCGPGRPPSRSSPGPGTSMWATWSLWPCISPPPARRQKIEKGKLRGVESNGMLCGLAELGLDTRDFPLRGHHPRRPAERLPSLWTRTSPPSPRTSRPGTRCSARWCAPRYWRLPSSPTAPSTPAWTWAAPPPAPTPSAPTSTRGTWWLTTPRPTPSAPWRTSTPSRRSSPTASPTASSFFTRTASPGTT